MSRLSCVVNSIVICNSYHNLSYPGRRTQIKNDEAGEGESPKGISVVFAQENLEKILNAILSLSSMIGDRKSSHQIN